MKVLLFAIALALAPLVGSLADGGAPAQASQVSPSDVAAGGGIVGGLIGCGVGVATDGGVVGCATFGGAGQIIGQALGFGAGWSYREWAERRVPMIRK